MRFEFRKPGKAESAVGQPRPLVHVEVILTEPPFAGLRIVGWAVWNRKDGRPGLWVGPLPQAMVKRSDTNDCQSSRPCRIAEHLKEAILRDFSSLGLAAEGSFVPATGSIDLSVED